MHAHGHNGCMICDTVENIWLDEVTMNGHNGCMIRDTVENIWQLKWPPLTHLGSWIPQ